MNRSRKDVTMMVAMAALLIFAVFNFVFKPQRSELSTAGEVVVEDHRPHLGIAELVPAAPRFDRDQEDAERESGGAREAKRGRLDRSCSGHGVVYSRRGGALPFSALGGTRPTR